MSSIFFLFFKLWQQQRRARKKPREPLLNKSQAKKIREKKLFIIYILENLFSYKQLAFFSKLVLRFFCSRFQVFDHLLYHFYYNTTTFSAMKKDIKHIFHANHSAWKEEKNVIALLRTAVNEISVFCVFLQTQNLFKLPTKNSFVYVWARRKLKISRPSKTHIRNFIIHPVLHKKTSETHLQHG